MPSNQPAFCICYNCSVPIILSLTVTLILSIASFSFFATLWESSGCFCVSSIWTILFVCPEMAVSLGITIKYFSMVSGFWLMPWTSSVLASQLYDCSSAILVQTPLNLPGARFTVKLPFSNSAAISGAVVVSCLISSRYSSRYSRYWGRQWTYLPWPATTRYGNIFSASDKCCFHNSARSACMNLLRIFTHTWGNLHGASVYLPYAPFFLSALKWR